VSTLGPKGLVIGGKLMGGRVASLVADEASVAGLVCLGYPFHPVGKPDRLRASTPSRVRRQPACDFGQARRRTGGDESAAGPATSEPDRR
jgi:predicted alpha/beta-hydrolase family hydrolase